MYNKLKRIFFYVMLLSFIIKGNECYGMKMNENEGEKTVIEKIKALPYSKTFIYGNKFFFSLAHSIVNNFYEIETIKLNNSYFLKKYLCWGYRLQPTFLSPFSFLDFNINILGGVIDTAIFIWFYPSREIKIPIKIFYTITSFLNINLNIRIKNNFYIAINILGVIQPLITHFLTKSSNKDDEKDNKLNIKNDNNLDNIKNDNILNNSQGSNNNPENNNENNKLNNFEGNNNDPENKIGNGKNNNLNDFQENNTDTNENNNNENRNLNNKNKKGDNLEIKISKEDEEKIKEIMEHLNKEIPLDNINEEEIGKIIIDNNYNYDKIYEDICNIICV